MSLRSLLIAVLVFSVLLGSSTGLTQKKKTKKKKEQNVTKIIPQKEFTDALVKLAKDERVPVASSTLTEKGRGEDYYGVEKLVDNNFETFWAEGAKGWGENEWVAFYVPDGTTSVEITPGAGKEQFKNFNRPKLLYLDIYLVKLKREGEEYTPTFKWLGRTEFNFQDKPQPVRKNLNVKLPELVVSERNMYVGVLIIRAIHKGQFPDTSIAEVKTSAIWGEE